MGSAVDGVGRHVVSTIDSRDYPVIPCFTLAMNIVFDVCKLVDVVA